MLLKIFLLLNSLKKKFENFLQSISLKKHFENFSENPKKTFLSKKKKTVTRGKGKCSFFSSKIRHHLLLGFDVFILNYFRDFFSKFNINTFIILEKNLYFLKLGIDLKKFVFVLSFFLHYSFGGALEQCCITPSECFVENRETFPKFFPVLKSRVFLKFLGFER